MNANPARLNRLKSVALRLCADAAAANVGLFLGLGARYVVLVGLGQAPRLLSDFTTSADLWQDSIKLYQSTAPLLTLIFLLVFALSGFYRVQSHTHTRTARVIIPAATVAFLLFAVASYAIVILGYLRGQQTFAPFPRSALFASWISTVGLLFAFRGVASVGLAARGGHLASHVIRNRYFLAGDLVLIPLAAWLSFLARLEPIGMERFLTPFLVYLVSCQIVKPVTFYFAGLYRRYWRYASIGEAITILGANLAATFGVILCAYVIVPIFFVSDPVPRSIPFIDFLMTTALVGGARFVARLLGDRRMMSRWGLGTLAANRPMRRVLIIGAGDAGMMIVKEMQSNPQLGLEPVVFLDDDDRKHGASLFGVPVAGDRRLIGDVVRDYQIQQAIIAMPTVSGKTIRELTRLCQQAKVPVKTVPGIFELLDGSIAVNQLHEVDIADLLRREPVETDVSQVVSLLRNKRVLITGAGGSIGSELCRQIARCKPALLLLLGHGENSLFDISNELSHAHASIDVKCLVADIRDAERMGNVFKQYHPQIVFHAAAHKHVPLMEENIEDAVSNNIQGTRQLLNCAETHNVEQFVLISSDKAVNPTSIMGATKRVAELLVQKAAARKGRCFVAVRFGNVLGSRGSVVPFFKQQIARGGPVTVTHPDVCRYFMTIPEAVQLVLQAATLGKGGEIFVLDMGQPIKIVDLARDLIRLSGLEEGQDIDIVFTGLRPGEKLFEELFITGESHSRTSHDKIFVVRDGSPQTLISKQFADLDAQVDTLMGASRAGNVLEARRLLWSIVPESLNVESTSQTTFTSATASRRPINPAGWQARSN